MKKYNLKKEHNWRGDIAELLAKHKYKAKRTKGYDFKPEPNFSKRQNAFLSRVWKSIDLYGCDDSGKLTIYEVKGKMHGVNGKPAITSTSLDAYRKARAKKIKVSLRSEEHTSELQSPKDLVCRLLLE